MTPPSPQVLVFLKAPRPGAVKTRLARQIGDEAAAQLYRRWAEDTLAKIPSGWRARVWFTPDAAEPEMREWLGGTYEFLAQGEGDLGARLGRAFAHAEATGAEAIIAIGGDCPDLERGDLEAAAEWLRSHDVVLGPAADGGYYLIGARRARPGLFRDIVWSTAAVFEQTLQRVRAEGLSLRLLAVKEDIDEVDALRRQQARQASVTPSAPTPVSPAATATGRPPPSPA